MTEPRTELYTADVFKCDAHSRRDHTVPHWPGYAGRWGTEDAARGYAWSERLQAGDYVCVSAHTRGGTERYPWLFEVTRSWPEVEVERRLVGGARPGREG